MNGKALTLSGLAVGGGAAVMTVMIRRWKGESSGAASGHSDRWHTVTINRPPDEVSANGRLSEPLAKLGDKIEVQVRPAPGDRGTEVAARLREPLRTGRRRGPAQGPGPARAGPPGSARFPGATRDGRGTQPRQAANDPPRSGRKLISAATARAREEGRL